MRPSSWQYLSPEACQVTNGVVFVIDDDPSVRRSVSRLLRSHDRFVQTYQSAQDFLDLELPPIPACIVLDLQMPGVNGLDLQRLLARNRDTLPIVFISGHGSIHASVRAMKEGAVDFLTKPFDDSQLIAAIDTALDRAQRAHERRNALDRDRTAFDSLTQRERQVCLRVAEGMLNKQIGCELGTSEKTIKAQRGQVMHKLGAHSVADLVRLVERLRASGQLEHQPTLLEN
jgi:FixJ family two-component response regulator